MPKRDDFTNWTLMHKNIPVAEVEMIEDTGTIVRVSHTHNAKHAPIASLNKERIDD